MRRGEEYDEEEAEVGALAARPRQQRRCVVVGLESRAAARRSGGREVGEVCREAAEGKARRLLPVCH
jgi:hypothetical protein